MRQAAGARTAGSCARAWRGLPETSAAPARRTARCTLTAGSCPDGAPSRSGRSARRRPCVRACSRAPPGSRTAPADCAQRICADRVPPHAAQRPVRERRCTARARAHGPCPAAWPAPRSRAPCSGSSGRCRAQSTRSPTRPTAAPCARAAAVRADRILRSPTAGNPAAAAKIAPASDTRTPTPTTIRSRGSVHAAPARATGRASALAARRRAPRQSMTSGAPRSRAGRNIHRSACRCRCRCRCASGGAAGRRAGQSPCRRTAPVPAPQARPAPSRAGRLPPRAGRRHSCRCPPWTHTAAASAAACTCDTSCKSVRSSAGAAPWS